MRRALITATLLSIAVASPLLSQRLPRCAGVLPTVTAGTLHSPQDYTLSWPAVPGVAIYYIEETRADAPFDTLVIRRYYTPSTSIRITHEAINDVTYHYRVVNYGPNACETSSQPIKTFGDVALRQAVRRGIVPVVGSARGANGAVFKTYLRLEGASLHGRIIFHPAGRVASDDDPSIPYDTSTKSEWDDIVAAIGQSGVGSLSIVPAENDTPILPTATVRLYNVASSGIYGANVELYAGIDFLDANQPFQRIEIPADGNFRVNVGARAVMAGTARAIAVGADGTQKGTVDRNFAAGEVVFGSPDAVYGLHVDPGDTLLVTFSRAIVPFYTLTDNRTNDPFLYVQGVKRTDILDQYVK